VLVQIEHRPPCANYGCALPIFPFKERIIANALTEDYYPEVGFSEATLGARTIHSAMSEVLNLYPSLNEIQNRTHPKVPGARSEQR